MKKISILKPIALSLLAGAVMTACGGGSSDSGKKTVLESCVYNIEGDNPIDISQGDTYTNPAAKLTLNGKDITNKLKVEGTVDTSKVGENKIIYSSESCSNTETRIVNVIKSSASLEACVYNIDGDNPMQINQGDKYENPVVKLMLKGKDITDKIKVEGTVDTSKVGENKIIYSSESCSNTETRIVNVVNPSASSIACDYTLRGSSKVKLLLNDTYTEEGVEVKDANDKVIEDYSITGKVATSEEGEYVLSYQGAGCSNAITRTVSVVNVNCSYVFEDESNPLIISKDAEYSPVKPKVTLPNSTTNIASDDIDEITNNVDVKKVGNYEVVYKAKGCSNTGARTVTVELPVCDYKFPDNKQTMDLIAGQNYVPPVVTIEGVKSSEITVSGEVKSDTIGEYIMTYAAKDKCKNSAKYIVNVKKVTNEELKNMNDTIGKTILPKI